MEAKDFGTVDSLDPRIAQELGYLGNTPAWFCAANNRFSYYLYVPQNYYKLKTLSLMVLIHSSSRNASELRKQFTEFAEKISCIILAPLFPLERDDPYNSEGYKVIKYNDLRCDQILLSMADEVGARYRRLDMERFLMFGFSGGAQFVHRFAYMYPQRLRAIACGAPGSQTLPDVTRPYPEGVKEMEQIFGIKMQWHQLCSIPSFFIVGEADTDTFYAKARGRVVDPTQQGRYGLTVRLEKAWRLAGANCYLHVVPGASHEEELMIGSVISFFETCLEI
ncbi:uncharacterized protein N7484_004115 [Penicillium longicatenatum]|uniref:uncharacterized protein n=1 Tax=Penicillium longicatenatum TaxID=1561947 RepID=UPI002548FF60|nr:uncharacterized protein N7484_004115 [Penicillium longicatenatum]KAJ5650392.1 hypothetical protein N7484_004115 [Penicillium longicatenatum]